MDRRTVLSALACLGALPALSSASSVTRWSSSARSERLASVFPTPLAGRRRSDGRRVGLIAVGGAGQRILTAVRGPIACERRLIAVDLDPRCLKLAQLDRRILIEPRPELALGDACRGQFDDALAGLDMAILVAGLGGVTGSSVAPEVARMTRARGIPTYAITLVPLAFSRMFGSYAAGTALDRLRKLTIATFQISDERRVAGQLGFLRGRPPENQYKQTVERLLSALTMPLSEHTLLNLSIEDFEEVLSGSEAVATGFGCSRGKDAAALATQRAIDHPRLGERRLRASRGILVLVETSHPLIELGDVLRTVRPIREAISEFFVGPVHYDYMVGPQTAIKEFRVTIFAGGSGSEAV